MRALLLPPLALAIAVVLFLSGGAQAEDIAVFPMDTGAQPALELTTDDTVKTQGDAALKITTAWPTTIPLAQIDAPGVDKTRLTYSAKVRSALEGEGTAYLEMWCIFKDGQYFSRGLDNPITGQSDWTTLSTPFFLKEGQTPEKIILNLVMTGSGTVWVDDIHLSAGPLE